MGAVLGNQVHAYTIGGREWKMVRSTWAMQDLWGTELANRAKKAALEVAAGYRDQAEPLRVKLTQLQKTIRELRGSSSPDAVDKFDAAEAEAGQTFDRIQVLDQAAAAVMERWQDRKASGEFEWFSATVGSQAQRNLPMAIYMLWLKLQPNHSGITLEEVSNAHLPNGEFGPDGRPKDYIREWHDALLESEGVLQKNVTTGTTQAATPPSSEPPKP